MESRKTAGSGGLSSRRRPLHTCAVSGLAIAHQVHTKAQDLNWPIGSMAKRVTKIANFVEPLLYALQYQCLAFLSFVDDSILAVESIVERVFPPSEYVFNKIDQFVESVEMLPRRFDDASNKVQMVIHRFPLLDWALAYVISQLNIWVNVFTKTIEDKEIMVDKSCDVELTTVEPEAGQESSSTLVAIEVSEAFPPSAETPKPEEAGSTDVKVIMSTCKEALEKGTAETTEKEDEKEKHIEQSDIGEKETSDVKVIMSTCKEALEKGTDEITEEEDEKETHMEQSGIGERVTSGGERNNDSDGSTASKDDILELFETAWHMPPRKGSEGSSVSRSGSEI